MQFECAQAILELRSDILHVEATMAPHRSLPSAPRKQARSFTSLELLTHTAILGLPGEEVQQRAQRLSHQTETHPENHVACRLAVDATDLLNDIRQDD